MAFEIKVSLQGGNIYTCLSSDTKKLTVPPGSVCYETDTSYQYEFDGSAWLQTKTTTDSGASARLMVSEISGHSGGQGINRELSAAQVTAWTTTAAARFTWPSGSRPKTVTIKPIGGAVWVCFDAPDAATGLVWCGESSGEAVDSQRYLVPEYTPANAEVAGGTAGDYGVQPTSNDYSFEFTDALSNMYLMEFVDATVTDLTVEAS